MPYYLRVRDHFASLIETGTLAPRSKLPPERVVGDAFGITRMTIRQALFQLEAEGLIYRLNRRGWFVSPPRLRYDPTANLSFTENVLAQGRVPSTTVLSSERVLASAWDREHLGVAANAPVFLIRRVRSIDDRAVLVEHVHLDARRCPGLLDEPLDRSMTEILAERYGISGRRRRIHMRPTALAQSHAQALNVAAGTPSLYVARTIYDQFGNVVEFDQEFWRHDVLDIMVDVHTNDGHTNDGHTNDGAVWEQPPNEGLGSTESTLQRMIPTVLERAPFHGCKLVGPAPNRKLGPAGSNSSPEAIRVRRSRRRSYRRPA